MKNLTDDQLRSKVRETLGIARPDALKILYSMSRERLEGVLGILEGTGAQPAPKARYTITHTDHGHHAESIDEDGRTIIWLNPGTVRGEENIHRVVAMLNQLPAPQSPVVPTDPTIDQYMDSYDEDGVDETFGKLAWDGEDEATAVDHAHAAGFRRGWKTLCAHLLANARESREDRYCEFVRKLYEVRNEPDKLNAMVMREHATVGKEG